MVMRYIHRQCGIGDTKNAEVVLVKTSQRELVMQTAVVNLVSIWSNAFTCVALSHSLWARAARLMWRGLKPPRHFPEPSKRTETIQVSQFLPWYPR